MWVPMATESRWSLTWAERPSEEASNFNPAFCGELIGRTVCEYYKAREAALNLATAFLVLPLTLHKPTRDALPGRANVAFAGWIAENNSLLAELPGRVNRLRPITREALLFAVRHRILAIREGGLVPGSKPIRLNAKPAFSTADVNEARGAAGLLGRWFANQGAQSSILQGMGVAP
jgi:hypothetical protein